MRPRHYVSVSGWRCKREPYHVGPCALTPCWWNVLAFWRFR